MSGIRPWSLLFLVMAARAFDTHLDIALDHQRKRIPALSPHGHVTKTGKAS